CVWRFQLLLYDRAMGQSGSLENRREPARPSSLHNWVLAWSTDRSQIPPRPPAQPHQACISLAGGHRYPGLYAQRAQKDLPPPLGYLSSPSPRGGDPGGRDPRATPAMSLHPASSTFPSSGAPSSGAP